MNVIWTIFKKEIIDSLRDRRTLIVMILVPLFLFPALISISSRVIMSQHRKAKDKVLTIALIRNGNAEDFRESLVGRSDVTVVEDFSLQECKERIKTDSLSACFEFKSDFDETVKSMAGGKVNLYFKHTDNQDVEKDRILDLLNGYGDKLRTERFAELGVDEKIIKTLNIHQFNLATVKEKLADTIGGFLPYLFIIFCFMGSMYPAIDLAAGEKERGTLETLLTSPVSKGQILTGKFMVVILTGTVSAAISILGLYIGITQVKEIPPEILSILLNIIELKSILLLLSLLVPLTVFLGGIELALSMYAKSFKEAQNLITPLMIIVIIPAFMGLLPGMKLDATTALVPVMNVSLATKAIIAGNIHTLHFMEVYGSLIFFGILGVITCIAVFHHEGSVFRS